MFLYLLFTCLVGLVVKASVSRAIDPGFESRIFYRDCCFPDNRLEITVPVGWALNSNN